MNEKIIKMFNPDCEEFDVDKQFELIEYLTDNEDVILEYIDEFIFLLNNVYLEDGVDSELELFMENIDRSLLIYKVLNSLNDMNVIDTIFDWERFLFDNKYIEYTIMHLQALDKSIEIPKYIKKTKEELMEFDDSFPVKERILNINKAINLFE